MKEKVRLTLITCLAYCVEGGLYRAIDYLREHIRVLIEQQEEDKCILLDNHQRCRLGDGTALVTPGLFVASRRRSELKESPPVQAERPSAVQVFRSRSPIQTASRLSRDWGG